MLCGLLLLTVEKRNPFHLDLLCISWVWGLLGGCLRENAATQWTSRQGETNELTDSQLAN